jgi:hypothetical protein
MHPSGNSDARAIGQQRVGADQGGAVSRKRALEVTRRSVSTSRRSPILASVFVSVVVGRSTTQSET